MTEGHKVVYALWRAEGQSGDALGEALLGELGPRLHVAGASAVQANVADDTVAGAMVRLTAFPEPVDAVVSVWVTSQEVDVVTAVLTETVGRVAGWFVEEETPTPPPVVPLRERQPGLANVALLRCPDEPPYARWLDLWKNHHTRVAIETQATFGYVQNRVVGPATEGAPAVHAIVEELFPIEAMKDLHAFYGSGIDDEELSQRMSTILEKVSAFGADRGIDVVPTSRYRLL